MELRLPNIVNTDDPTSGAEPRIFCVYRHTGPTGKVYIGMTGQRPEARWGRDGRGYKSSKHFFSAILKHGWENFTHEIVEYGLTKAEAEALEIRLIAEHNSTNREFGYNSATGGGVNRGNRLSEERKAEISAFMKQRETLPETREKLRRANIGKRHTEASKVKMREAKLGKKLSEETRDKMRISNVGKRAKRVECIDTGVIYRTVYEAELATGALHTNIAKVCRGKRQTAAGLRWRYPDAC